MLSLLLMASAFTLNGYSVGSAINPTADFYSVRFGLDCDPAHVK